ncbi:hypothetical protein [Vibrio coralliilyticus]|uniref:hypothetical protein n=1 Tax=Vibrio coralliilyticus TaxID=190893 RepID=UPI001E28AC45|nr:hypothetical protein [Vibrio coralliilyticus]MCC2525526.1 hypothetical protein [Vibrio coralliilyticus]
MTNDFSQVGELVTETRKLLDSLTGDLANRFVRAETKTILVGGVWEKFYPVFIPAPSAARLNHLQIFRSEPDKDKNGIKHEDGSTGMDTVGGATLALKYVTCDVKVQPYTEVVCNMFTPNYIPFVARIQNCDLMSGMVVWLRGGNVTYEYTQDSMMVDIPPVNEIKVFPRFPNQGIRVDAGVYLEGFRVDGADFYPTKETHETAMPKPDGSDTEWEKFR